MEYQPLPYLIDGHNLIPKMRGLSLRTLDDEMILIKYLQEFSRISRQGVEVYFDAAAPGQAGGRHYGTVTAHFVQVGKTADDALAAHLYRMKKAARNWTLVSSDFRVQASGREVGAKIMASEAFARLLYQTLEQTGNDLEKGDHYPDDYEMDEWMRLFGQK